MENETIKLREKLLKEMRRFGGHGKTTRTEKQLNDDLNSYKEWDKAGRKSEKPTESVMDTDLFY